MASTKKAERQRATLGPKAERLKLEGNWRDGRKKSFGKKKPAGGWPSNCEGRREQLCWDSHFVS